MNHFILYLLSIISCLNCFSQKKSNSIQVEYTMYCDTDVPLMFKTILWANNTTAVYQEKASTTQRWQDKPLGEALQGKPVNYDALKSDFEPYFKTEKSGSKTLLYAQHSNNTFLIEDTYTMKWDIGTESKTIGGYKCIKAITNFRGREWIAWFAPDIPLPFGPWKFKGLPGLILEVHDISNRYTYKPEKITKLESNEIFNKDFAAVLPARNKKPITYRQYLKDKDEAFENSIKSIDQELGVKTTIRKPPVQNKEEVVYEWEK